MAKLGKDMKRRDEEMNRRFVELAEEAKKRGEEAKRRGEEAKREMEKRFMELGEQMKSLMDALRANKAVGVDVGMICTCTEYCNLLTANKVSLSDRLFSLFNITCCRP